MDKVARAVKPPQEDRGRTERTENSQGQPPQEDRAGQNGPGNSWGSHREDRGEHNGQEIHRASHPGGWAARTNWEITGPATTEIPG